MISLLMKWTVEHCFNKIFNEVLVVIAEVSNKNNGVDYMNMEDDTLDEELIHEKSNSHEKESGKT